MGKWAPPRIATRHGDAMNRNDSIAGGAKAHVDCGVIHQLMHLLSTHIVIRSSCMVVKSSQPLSLHRKEWCSVRSPVTKIKERSLLLSGWRHDGLLCEQGRKWGLLGKRGWGHLCGSCWGRLLRCCRFSLQCEGSCLFRSRCGRSLRCDRSRRGRDNRRRGGTRC
jgi:hypothetical protein